MRLEDCRKINIPRKTGGYLFKSETHAFRFFGTASFADDCLSAAFALRNRLREAHLRFLQGHDATL